MGNQKTLTKARPSAQALRDLLEDDILNGRLKPGERLDEAALGQRFGVSRTPIREAFRYLAASDLVEIVPKRGTFVVEIGLPRLIEMFEVMAELEGMCARLAARRHTDAEASALQQALSACEQAAAGGDADRYYYENERFHDCIYEASHNGFLVQQARQLRARLKPYRRLQLRVRNRVQRSLEEHRRIVEAIAAGDPGGAERALEQHITVQGERFTDLVASVGEAGA